MMSDGAPYKLLGEKLKFLREQAKQSLFEVSGAVEIDESTLAKIESGKQLPEEEILALLASHFKISEKDTLNLWHLAGYNQNIDKESIPLDDLKQLVMVIPFENRVLYSDVAHIASSEKGVVIDFGFKGDGVKPYSISKVGMSKQQAVELIKQLSSSIYLSQNTTRFKQLPKPQNNKKANNKS